MKIIFTHNLLPFSRLPFPLIHKMLRIGLNPDARCVPNKKYQENWTLCNLYPFMTERILTRLYIMLNFHIIRM